jgi:hypothetical protein
MATDLFGNPLPDVPAMTDPLPWRVFRLNECEWYMARTLEEAIAEYRSVMGLAEHEVASYLDRPRELTDQELDRLQFCDYEQSPPTRRSFREELAARAPAPQFFASTEV